MQEPSWLMRQVLYHFGSGDAVFLGLSLLIIGGQAVAWNWPRRFRNLIIVLGILWVSISGWPSVFLQAMVMITAIVTLFSDHQTRFHAMRFHLSWPHGTRRGFFVPLALVSGVAILVQYTTLAVPRITVSAASDLAIIGDSVTAGLNDDDDTWPQQLARISDLSIRNASQQGATLNSAQKQLQTLGDPGNILILEIGGNDLLELRPVGQFARELESLLRAASQNERTVIMFELPLPPLANRYGYHQRRLARNYGVSLIPKREFMWILTTPGSTVDGVHLSDLGQERMAMLIKKVIRVEESGVSLKSGERQTRRNLATKGAKKGEAPKRMTQ